MNFEKILEASVSQSISHWLFLSIVYFNYKRNHLLIRLVLKKLENVLFNFCYEIIKFLMIQHHNNRRLLRDKIPSHWNKNIQLFPIILYCHYTHQMQKHKFSTNFSYIWVRRTSFWSLASHLNG